MAMELRRRKSATKQFAVLGLGRFGSSVAKTLYNMGHEVLALDADEDKVREMAALVTHTVQADATDESTMRGLGLRNLDVVVVAIGDLQASVLATLILRDIGVKHIVAKAISDLHGKVLQKVGADRIVYPERDMGTRVAHNLVSGNLIDYLELAPGYSIIEVVAPEPFIGNSLKRLDLRAKYGVSVVAIKRGDEVRVAPGADDLIQRDDVLVAMGEDRMLEYLESGDRTG